MIASSKVSGPERVIAAKVAAIRRRSGIPAAKRALFRIVHVPAARAVTYRGHPTSDLTSAQKAERARAEMAALRKRFGR